MQIAQYNENERIQKIKVTNKATHRASLNTVEQSGDENDSLTTTVTAKPNKTIRENHLFTKIEDSNSATREQVASLEQTVQCLHMKDKTLKSIRPKLQQMLLRGPRENV